MRMFFVGGIHGSGKTTFCQSLAVTLGVPHYSAGELIRFEMSYLPQEGKRVADVGDNQRLLFQALNKISKAISTIVLDGHYTLINSQGAVKPIGLDVFRSLKPTALLLVSEEPTIVARRLKERDGQSYDPRFLTQHSLAETAHAELVSTTLEVPLFVLDSPHSADDAVRSLSAANLWPGCDS